MLLDRVIHFGENVGDHLKSRSPKKLKLLIEVLYVAAPESTGSKFPYDGYLKSVVCCWTGSGEFPNLEDQVKGRSPKKLKLLIAKVHTLSHHMILIS